MNKTVLHFPARRGGQTPSLVDVAQASPPPPQKNPLVSKALVNTSTHQKLSHQCLTLSVFHLSDRNEPIFLLVFFNPRRLSRAFQLQRICLHVTANFLFSLPARGTLGCACTRPCRRPSYDAFPWPGNGGQPSGERRLGNLKETRRYLALFSKQSD